MLVSQLRNSTSDKREKDTWQAAVLVAVLAEQEPGAIETAWAAVRRSARKKTAVGAAIVARKLEAEHARAAELLQSLARA
jgi:hypothetical protein